MSQEDFHNVGQFLDIEKVTSKKKLKASFITLQYKCTYTRTLRRICVRTQREGLWVSVGHRVMLCVSTVLLGEH